MIELIALLSLDYAIALLSHFFLSTKHVRPGFIRTLATCLFEYSEKGKCRSNHRTDTFEHGE